MEPTTVSATYKTPTSISLEWTFARAPLYDYSYVVYYESGGESHSVSFTDRGRSRDNSHLLTGLPVGGIHTISLVALVDLPSPVVGPVAPGKYAPTSAMLRLSRHFFNFKLRHSFSRASRGGGIRRRVRSGRDLIHTDM